MQLSRLASLWIQAVFVGLVGLLVIRFALCYDVSRTHWVQVLLPVTRGAYWYLSAFSLLFVLAPILNLAINGLDRRTLTVMLLVVFTLCSLSTPWFRDEFNGFGMGLINGYSAIWLLIMYLAGGYICKYKNIMPSRRACALVILLGACVSSVMYILVRAKIPVIPPIAFRVGMFGGYRNPLVVIMSISIFMLCIQTRISNALISRCLTWGASVSFGVYLIHVHPYVWRYIWVPKLNSVHAHNAAEWLAWVLGGTLLVFVGCGILESLRAKLFALLRINRLTSLADRIINYEQ